jgi:hypothetical protein
VAQKSTGKLQTKTCLSTPPQIQIKKCQIKKYIFSFTFVTMSSIFHGRICQGFSRRKRCFPRRNGKKNTTVEKEADTGFQGRAKSIENIVMPKNGTKKNSLTKEGKENNRVISSFRVLTDILRNRMGIFDDLVMEIGAGMWNYHLRYTQ